jgi:hypothetical protein
MADTGDCVWLDDAAGRLVRLYTVSNGRTHPTAHFELLTMVMATGTQPQTYLGPDHAQVLGLCGSPVSVAEIAATVRLPAAVTKVLLSDLVDCGALTTRAPHPVEAASLSDRDLLEAVLRGLRKQL